MPIYERTRAIQFLNEIREEEAKQYEKMAGDKNTKNKITPQQMMDRHQMALQDKVMGQIRKASNN